MTNQPANGEMRDDRLFRLTSSSSSSKVAVMPKSNTCKRCGYEWESKLGRGGKPKSCPRCKSYDWQKEKSNGTK